MAHTPGPWHAKGYVVEDSGGQILADCDCLNDINENLDNAVLIVRAVNNHDSMLAALHLAAARFALMWPDREPSSDTAWQAVVEAIAGATNALDG